MTNRDIWNGNVSRVEYDHRARDTRRRLEQIERLLVKRDAVGGLRYFEALLSFLGITLGGRRRTGSPDDPRSYQVGMQGQRTRNQRLSVITAWQL